MTTCRSCGGPIRRATVGGRWIHTSPTYDPFGPPCNAPAPVEVGEVEPVEARRPAHYCHACGVEVDVDDDGYPLCATCRAREPRY